MQEEIFIALVGVNAFVFLLMGLDKWRAIHHKRRVPEKTFYILALCFGSLGVLAGMYAFRHKVSKTSFQFVLAVIILIQIGLLAWFYGVI
ncbi:DUF1294 domain-containing protein [Candidatus Uhrbacteria bacterium]|jgi:uncharacterized membrane protein YsdA (DUF1294 family)|nr:DUF1294 domain-containing protein [Candidatus Uhrbacteria bacterium]